MDEFSVSAHDAILGNHGLILHDGVGYEIGQCEEHPRLRSSYLMAAASRLRKSLAEMSSETPVDAKVEITAVDAVVLLDLLLRRVG